MTRAPRCGMRTVRRAKVRGVMLLEALLAVTIFAIGVITLGRCMSNCIAAQRMQEEDGLARRLVRAREGETNREYGYAPCRNTKDPGRENHCRYLACLTPVFHRDAGWP